MSTRTRILEEIGHEAGLDVTDEAVPCTDLGDRLDWIDLVFGLELAFDIELTDEEENRVYAQTVGDLVDLVQRKVEG